MSFSSDTKLEIIKNEINKKCCAIAELLAIVCFGGALVKTETGYSLQINTENAKIARRIYNLIKFIFNINANINVYKKTVKTTGYSVLVDDDLHIKEILNTLKLLDTEDSLNSFLSFKIYDGILDRVCCKKSFVRGAFLMSGSLSNPEKNYHLEFVTHRFNISNDFIKILTDMDLVPKTIIRKSNYVLYFKNSEMISDVLTILGAVNAVWEIQNIKIVKEIRNNSNRVYNFEDANMNKTIDASTKQRMCIEKINEAGKMDELPPLLKEIALLRLENSECSLKELGEMLTPPISKSGVNHRLRKLQNFADKI